MSSHDLSADPVARGRIVSPSPARDQETAGKKPPPAVKPKPHILSAAGASQSLPSPANPPASSIAPPITDDLSQELANVHLRKTGSRFSAQEVQTKKAVPPPVVPRKSFATKQAPPPVPNKNASLRQDQQESNPFERYLKSAVPSEHDRLHKPT